ncbi:type ISP restriction/modification enzyme [uncultured Sphingomonas sp.]|uniref:type ISP restriction/modification enzyme n=1 Tax=uncultured Sphingomonas sp. TaxID=158754 RepID=UPI0035CAD3F9
MTQDGAAAKAVSGFGAAAKAKLANVAATGQPEDQLRGPLEALIPALASAAGIAGEVVLVGETSLADLKTRPDYSVTLGAGPAKGGARALIGFIEVKAPGKGFDPRRFTDAHDKAQWAKLKALPNLIYTDGNGLSLWRNGEIVGKPLAFDGDVETSGAKLGAPAGLLSLIGDFLSWQPVAPRKPAELAATAARLCRFLRDEVLEQLEQDNAELKGLAADWRALLFPDASDERFADGYAQAVTFGLLMAKSRKLILADGLDRVARELGKTDTLIGAALRLLTEQEVLGPSLATLVRVLDVVDWDVIAKGDPEAWLYFYEQFLGVYDNRLRKLTGSYYTPPEVVQAMVRLCDEALKSPARFDRHKGLADPMVQIADPAVGSGTFLLALLRHIAGTIEAEQGKPAVGPAMAEVAKRLFGFELQFGAYAVAELRLMAEMIDLNAAGLPRLFVTDTLSDPHATFESGQGIYKEISRQQATANEVKRAQPITVVIGNPPYKEKAKGKGAWIENGSGTRPAPLKDWQPPAKWGVGAHAKHLRNLYVYFWRWAAWKVFEQGSGGRDQEPPVAEHLSGLVCYITVAGFLNGPGFQKMRSDLRRDCDEIWVIDCSPEGHQPEVATRIFEGVQHPVCIVLASRSPDTKPDVPAKVSYRALKPGRREAKFAELAALSLASPGWLACAVDPRAPFLPDLADSWASFVPLDKVVGYVGPGVTAGRTWVIAPDASTLSDRWTRLLAEREPNRKETLFHPTLRKDKQTGAYVVSGRHIRKVVSEPLGNRPTRSVKIIDEKQAKAESQRYGFRSFDRQYLIADARVISDPRPNIWNAQGKCQAYITAPMDISPSGGPALTVTNQSPDKHHYSGRGGHVFALWKDAAATQTNITYPVLAALTKLYGGAPDPVDVFAYVAATLAHPAYTDRFRADLVRPGLRVPLTADKTLFAEAAALGREVIWLHSFGERMGEGRPAGPPRLPGARAPKVTVTIPSTSDGFPDAIDWDAATNELKVGAGPSGGRIGPVTHAMWTYQVSGKQVLRQWFSYRKKNRERPQIGDRRPPSPLGDIQPDHWLPEYTEELLNVLNVLGLLIDLEPEQADLLERVVDGPLVAAGKVAGGVAA